MNPTRTLAFVLGVKHAWVQTAVVTALEALIIQQFELAYDLGGKTVISGSIGGESVTYTVPGQFSPDQLAELCRALYADIEGLTDAELRTYALAREPASYRLTIALNP